MPNHTEPIPRDQLILFPDRLDDLVSQDHPVRAIDAFVESLDLDALRFARVRPSHTGRPPYQARHLLKLFLYGYYHRLRSSRRLEWVTHSNIEVIWLLGHLRPDHKTIANFRKDNLQPLKDACRQMTLIFGRLNLLSNLFAVDSSAFRACNDRGHVRKDNHFEKLLGQIDELTDAYFSAMAEQDQKEHGDVAPSIPDLKARIERVEKEVKKYQKCLTQAKGKGSQEAKTATPPRQSVSKGDKASGLPGKRDPLPEEKQGQKDANAPLQQADATQGIQPATAEDLENLQDLKQPIIQAREFLKQQGKSTLCLTDPGARVISNKRENGFVPAYATFVAVDTEHKFILDFEVTDRGNDFGELAPMSLNVKALLDEFGQEHPQVVADKGFYKNGDLKTCCDNGIETFVPSREKSKKRVKGMYQRNAFTYQEEEDCYLCPAGEKLRPVGKLDRHGSRRYRATACKHCPLKPMCTESKQGRELNRWQDEWVLEQNEKRVLESPHILEKRRCVEAPFGWMKRWGFGRFLLKGKMGASGEMALTVMAYNMKRLLKMVPMPELMALLQPMATGRA